MFIGDKFLQLVKILYFCLGWVEILMTPLDYLSLKLIDLLQRLSSKKILNCLKMKKSLIFNSDLQVIKGRPLKNQKNISVDLIVMYKNQEKTITEEILVYDTPTMISQIGGILSLFLGFSFFSIICDLMELVSNFKKLKT